MAKKMFDNLSAKQTQRLINYAESEITRLVETHAFTNQTMNLQDSYVWIVYYNGKKAKHGYYSNKMAKSKSVLHEFSPSISVDVDGRALARKFAQTYTPDVTRGWEIVFAACAPYGAYLEGGFMLNGKKYQFDVLSQRYDEIKKVLSPYCNVRFEVNQPIY